MNEFIAGLFGGTLGLAVGHPFDTIKALMQTRNQKSISSTTHFLFKEKKFVGFFRGLTLPFICYGPTNSILFGVYGNTLKYLEKKQNNTNTNEPCLRNVFISGCIAGTLITIPTNPLELIKIQLQTHNRKEVNGVLDCVKKIYTTYGIFGFFRGSLAILYRDLISYGIYFFTFEYLRRQGKSHNLTSPIFIDLVCGGFAGSFSWLTIMPLDYVKSKLQADIDKKITIVSVIKTTWKIDGFKGFFKGVSAVIIRGFVVNSITFCTYIQIVNFLNQKNIFY